MNIGIPKECRPDEFRVGISPVGVRMLRGAGHTCFVETGAGTGSGFTDEQYRQAGATIVHSAEEAWRRADLVLKVSRPTMEELDWLQPGKALMGVPLPRGGAPGKGRRPPREEDLRDRLRADPARRRDRCPS